MSLLVKLCVNGLQFNKQDLFGNASSWNTVVYHTSGAIRRAHHLIAVAQKANAISCFTASTNHSRNCDSSAYGLHHLPGLVHSGTCLSWSLCIRALWQDPKGTLRTQDSNPDGSHPTHQFTILALQQGWRATIWHIWDNRKKSTTPERLRTFTLL